MKKKVLLSLLILGVCAGCGKVPKMANGEEAVVSFTKEENATSNKQNESSNTQIETNTENSINSNTTNISGVCSGRRKSCKGYIWRYV